MLFWFCNFFIINLYFFCGNIGYFNVLLLWVVVMYFGNASYQWCSFIMDCGYVSWKCWLPMFYFNMDYGDIFWKYRLFVLIHLSLWSCFSKMKVITVEFSNDFCK
jgi:hypothetical protein